MFFFFEKTIRKALFFYGWQRYFNREVSKKISKINKSKTEQENIFAIVDEVKDKGFFVLKEVISSKDLVDFNAEYNKFFQGDERSFYGIDKHDGAICIRVKPLWSLMNVLRYPITLSFFNSRSFQKIAECFYNKSLNNINFMSEIFVHNTVQTTEPLSGALHWDRAQTLKFWIYLNDVEIENGPIRIELNSRDRNIKKRCELNAGGDLVGGVDNVVSPDNEVVAQVAPAGSILIHDTDASHGATFVAKDKERKIIRGHCRLN